MQCCNDVVQERFAPELKYDIALRIAALHMHQHAITNKMQAKLTVKNIEWVTSCLHNGVQLKLEIEKNTIGDRRWRAVDVIKVVVAFFITFDYSRTELHWKCAFCVKIINFLPIRDDRREYGLERFVPTSLVEAMKRKELRKLLSHFVKVNQQLTAPGQKQLTALQAKLHYLKIISELPSYGAKCFSTNFKVISSLNSSIHLIIL